MSKFIPYHIVCPMASCTRSNTCARYANYLKEKAEADSFEVLNLDHLKIADDNCPYHLVTERGEAEGAEGVLVAIAIE